MNLKCVIAAENIDRVGIGPACRNNTFVDDMRIRIDANTRTGSTLYTMLITQPTVATGDLSPIDEVSACYIYAATARSP